MLDAPSWEHIVYNMRPPIAHVFKDGISMTEHPSAPRLVKLHGHHAPNMDVADSVDLSTLTNGLPLDPMPPKVVYDDDKPLGGLSAHAPARPVALTPELRRQAIANALRYFPARCHEELAQDFADELDRFGHIYMHRFLPRDAATGEYNIKARPVGSYPVKTPQAAALMHMIQNNLDPAVAQYPAELVTYGGNGSAFSNWAQYHETMRLLSEMDEHQCVDS